MASIEFDQLRTLVKVVQAGSFTRAAELLGSEKARVSRVISRLESQLGVRLLERTTRSLRLTEVGREIFERSVTVLAAVEETEQVAARVHDAPRGVLKLTCGVEFGMLAANAWVSAYLQRYADVAVEADYTNRLVDLVHEGFDVAIRVGELADSSLAARRLGELTYGLYAAPAYLERHGVPRRIDALSGHARIMFTGGIFKGGWRLADQRGRHVVGGPARLAVNNSFAARDAAAAGLGIALLPDVIGRTVPLLRRVLPKVEGPRVPFSAVFPSARYLTPKVRAFVDLALEQSREAFAAPARRTADASSLL
jgi:LysR family transcriptional regulator, regulator for bpeEF and oprC